MKCERLKEVTTTHKLFSFYLTQDDIFGPGWLKNKILPKLRVWFSQEVWCFC